VLRAPVSNRGTAFKLRQRLPGIAAVTRKIISRRYLFQPAADQFRAKIAVNLAKQIRALIRHGEKAGPIRYHLSNRQPKGAGHLRDVARDLVWFNTPARPRGVYAKKVTTQRPILQITTDADDHHASATYPTSPAGTACRFCLSPPSE